MGIRIPKIHGASGENNSDHRFSDSHNRLEESLLAAQEFQRGFVSCLSSVALIRFLSFHQFIQTQYHDRHITLFRRDHRFRDPVILPGQIFHRIFIHM